MLLLKNPVMAALLTYYPSLALTQAEKNLNRWKAEHAKKVAVEQAIRAEAVHIFPLAFAHARIMAAEKVTERYAGFMEQAKGMVAAERASAFLAYSTAEAKAAESKSSWLTRAVGNLLVAVIHLIPSRVSAPAYA